MQTLDRRPGLAAEDSPSLACRLAVGFAVMLIWLLACWAGPVSAQSVTLLDITQTGAELTSNPNVVFYEMPVTNGTSIDLTNIGETILFEWTLLPASDRRDLQVTVVVDYTRVTPDSDPTIGFHDGVNLVGVTRSDNDAGTILTREGEVDGLNLPTFTSGLLAPGLDPLETFELTYDLPASGVEVGAFFAEGTDSMELTFSSNPVDGSAPLTLYWGGSTIGEVHRIDQIRVTVSEQQVVTEVPTMSEWGTMALVFALMACAVAILRRPRSAM